MTFSTLSYLVWYRTYRRHIKDMIDSSDFSGAQTMLENLIAEHESRFPNDHSVMNDELLHMKHALKHILVTNASSSPEAIFRLTRIFTYEPSQNS